MESIIDNFISGNNLDESIKDSLIEVVNKCFTCYVDHMSKEWLNNVPTVNTTKGGKTSPGGSPKAKTAKVDKLEDPTEAFSKDDLRRCTSVILNTFCKDNGLKTGGNKSDLIERVWAYIEGQQSGTETTVTKTAKPKKGKSSSSSSSKNTEKHQCSGCNDKGLPCGTSATEEYLSDSGETQWFCWRHITDAKKIISNKNLDELVSHPSVDSGDESELEPIPELVAPPKKKVTKPKKATPAQLEESD